MVIQQPSSTSLNSITELFRMVFFLKLNDRIKIIVLIHLQLTHFKINLLFRPRPKIGYANLLV